MTFEIKHNAVPPRLDATGSKKSYKSIMSITLIAKTLHFGLWTPQLLTRLVKMKTSPLDGYLLQHSSFSKVVATTRDSSATLLTLQTAHWATLEVCC